jgi:hypothetical protein
MTLAQPQNDESRLGRPGGFREEPRKNRLYLPKIHPNEGWQNRARHERTRLPDDAGSASR